MKGLQWWLAAGLAAAGTALGAARPDSDPPAAEANVKEFVYKKIPQGELKIYVHYPKDWKATDKRPGIVFFFGGGWTSGTPEQFIPQATYFASRGMVCGRADYRVKSRQGVTPEVCVEDANSAMRWFRKNASELGVDPDRIVASGGSAGGHLAACMGTVEGLNAEGEDVSVSARANAMILFNPALKFAGIPQMMQRLGKDDENLARQISPTLNLKKDSPPALLLFGTKDFLLEQGKEFMARAKEVGHAAELYLAEDQTHGFFNRSPWLERTIKRADEFLIKLGYLTGEPTIQEGDFKDWKRPTDRQAPTKRAPRRQSPAAAQEPAANE